MRQVLMALFVVGAETGAARAGDGWTCSNEDFEVTCDSDQCSIEQAGDFTPTVLTAAPGVLSYCAYSGCWTGTPSITQTDESFYAVGSDLRWIHDTDAAGVTVQAAIDTITGRGVVLGGGFAMPVKCAPWACGEDCQSNAPGK